jgi:tetratricopeptide (TPR) repeat protein
MTNIDYLKKQASSVLNLYRVKKFEEVINKCKVLIKKFPEQVVFYNAMALSFASLNKNEEGLRILNKALKYHNNNILVLNNIGLLNSNLNNNKLSREYYDKVLSLNSNFVDVHVNKANLELKENNVKESEKLFLKAKSLCKNIQQKEIVNIGLGQLYQQIGNFEKSINIFNEILKDNPLNTVIHKLISESRTYKSKDDDHLKKMIALLNQVKDPDLLHNLYFSLSKAFEDVGSYEQSFNYLREGNKILDAKFNYDIRKDFNLFEDLKNFFLKNNLKDLENSNKFIFIVGMPRSGTTLTEQIISSHSSVYGAGELPFLTMGINKFLLKEDLIKKKKISMDQLQDIKNFYLKGTKSFQSNNKIIIDKAPLNYRWIGFIKKLFPNSKIIHCQRDPMDTCFSNFKNSFKSNAMSFGNCIVKLGQYFNLYKNLMNFWNNQYPNTIYNLSYENLTSNQEAETKKLIEFCELDWENNCLLPHQNKNRISTASLAQARLPVYKTSINKWKNYSKYLKELEDIIYN